MTAKGEIEEKKTSLIQTKEDSAFELVDIKNEEIPALHSDILENKNRHLPLTDDILSSEFSSDVDSDMPMSAIPSDYRSKRTKKLSSPARTFKAIDQQKLKKYPEPLHLSILPQPTSTYCEDQEKQSPKLEMNTSKICLTPDKSSKSPVNRCTKHRLHKQLSIVRLDDDNYSESSEEEYYNKKLQRPTPLKAQEKKMFINLDDEQQQSSSTDHREKSPRPVERNDTVIYKGPKDSKDKNLLDLGNIESLASEPPLSPIILHSPSTPVPRNVTTDGNFLKVPAANLKDIAPKSPYPLEKPSGSKSNVNFPDDARLAEILNKKYRQSCIMDLIKIIDSKMMSHQTSYADSTRRRKFLAMSKETPSPEFNRQRISDVRTSRSRSPESNYNRHHPLSSHLSSLSIHRLSRHTKKPHYESCESIIDRLPHPNTSSEQAIRHLPEKIDENPTITAAKSLMSLKPCDKQTVIPVELLEMLALKSQDNSKTNLNFSVTSGSTTPTSSTTSITTAYSPDANTILETKTTNAPNATDNLCVSRSPSIRRLQQPLQSQNQIQENHQQASTSPTANQQHTNMAHSPAAKNPMTPLHRRSSDSDLSITPKGNSLTGSERSMVGYSKPSSAIIRTMNQEALEMLEYPFITMQQYPPGFVLHIGGLVSARSVKLLERISNVEEPEGRDAWWTEIRMEVRSHARALACNVVIGYKEETSICDDVCVLSGSGTAAVINLHSTGQDQESLLITHVQGPTTVASDAQEKSAQPIDEVLQQQQQQQSIQQPQAQVGGVPVQQPGKIRAASESNEHEPAYGAGGCGLCHLPYNKSSVNFQVNVSKCAVCHRAKVPDVLFTTVDLPEGVPMTGRASFIQATVCKAKKDLRAELNAKEISDCLPFLEYELHSLLLNKLRVRGMNAAFGLKIQVSIGERLVIGMAVGTAVYLTALPQPSLPQIATGNSWHDEEQLADMQKSLVETVKKNMEFYQLKPVTELDNGRSMSDTDESEDELPELDLALGMKDVCVLEVDDIEDIDRISLLMDERPPNDFFVVNVETIPGLEDLEIVRNLQMFTQVSRAKIPVGQSASMPSKYFARLLQTVYFKLRRMVPCALCDLQFKIEMPEQDEIQLSVVGMALGLGEPIKCNKFRKRLLSHSMSKEQVKKTDDSDMIFSLDEDHLESGVSADAILYAQNASNISPLQQTTLNAAIAQKVSRPRSPLRIKHTTHRHKHVPLKERYGVDITPLSYLPGGRIDRYLGNLNFFFIRESNSIRESGGLSGFIHSFITEVLAIVRAHVTAVGGNAMVAFFMNQCVLLHSPHKNQGQCLINVGGDVVNVSYFGNEKLQQTNAGSNC